MLQKWKVGGTVIWAKSDALAVCLGVPQKRLSKSSYKTNIILTCSVQRPSHVPTCVSRCSFAFGKEMKKLGPAWPISRRRSSIWKVLKGIWTYAHRCLVKKALLFLSRKFNGIGKIVRRFIAKADRRKSPKSKLNLSMPKRTPKWPSLVSVNLTAAQLGCVFLYDFAANCKTIKMPLVISTFWNSRSNGKCCLC